MWDEPFNGFHLPTQPILDLLVLAGFWTHATIYCEWIIWVGEVTGGQSLAKRLVEFSAGLRVAEEEGQKNSLSFLFFQSVCACLQH